MEGPECALRHFTFPDFPLFPLGCGQWWRKVLQREVYKYTPLWYHEYTGRGYVAPAKEKKTTSQGNMKKIN